MTTIELTRDYILKRLAQNQTNRGSLALAAARGSADAAEQLDRLDDDDQRIQRELSRLALAEQEQARIDQEQAHVAAQERNQHLKGLVTEQEAIQHAAFQAIDALVDSLVDQARIAVSAVAEIERLNSALGQPAPATSLVWFTVRRIGGRFTGAFWAHWPGILMPGDARPLAGEDQS